MSESARTDGSAGQAAARIEQHHGGDTCRTLLEALISLASRAAELFERSNIDERRQLLAFVFSNLNLRGKKLEFSMRSPFDLMVGREDYPSWLGDLDSNQGCSGQSREFYR